MAVTKIRKISSWTLIACTVITLVVIGLFFLGGDNEPLKGELWNPIHVDTILYWQYILLGLTTAATLIFGIWQFAVNFKDNPKGGITGLVILGLFAALLFITYAIGDGNALPNIMNSEAQAYNIPFWLKISDMFLYSTYALIGLVILAIFAGSIKKILDK
ncbi:hypothetical protein [Parabacteroides sp. PF5-9]|uniref:hypothetical protein n=1 Tax=Parabacteroides sp. PF5-9 TaxID=1742404 RepID=UPI00247405C0|nr:hypothetical protein [Parabacteroides sp. PF5-9]MDH6358103.1 polyferredoxin [Parabacteroides sp. PF5-9]